MKKIFAVSAIAAAAFASWFALKPVAKKPMQAISWSKVSTVQPDNISLHGHIGPWNDTAVGHKVEFDLIKTQKIKSLFVQQIPTLSGHVGDKCSDHTHACPWFDSAIAEKKLWFSNLMTEMKGQNLTLDYMDFDIEDYSWGSWQMCHDATWFAAIQNDPRFLSWGYPATELTSICQNWPNHASDVWDGFMEDWMGKSYSTILLTLKNALPATSHISDFNRHLNGPLDPLDFNCHMNAYRSTNGQFGKGYLFGDRSTYEIYGALFNPNCRDASQGLDFPYPQDTFHALLYDLNSVIAGKAVANNVLDLSIPNQLWDPNFWYREEKWYRESIYHSYLLGNQIFLYWNPAPPWGTTDEAQEKLFSDILKEADVYLGFEDRKAMTTKMIPWNAGEIKTCAVANRKTVCRVTKPDGTGNWLY